MLLLILFVINALAGARVYYTHPRLYKSVSETNLTSIIVNSCAASIKIDFKQCKFLTMETKSQRKYWRKFTNKMGFSVVPVGNVFMLYEFWDKISGNDLGCQPYSCTVFGLFFPYYGRAIASCDPKNNTKAMYHLKLNGFLKGKGTYAERNICGIEDLTK